MPLSTRNHWLPRVTPGRSAALADFLPRMRLMNVDLPTFRDADDHHADGLADQTLLIPLGDLVRQQRANRTGERLRTIAAAAVGLDDRHALLTEMLRPDSRHVRISQVDAVKDHHARLACCNLIHIRVAGHLRNACVHDLTDRIHLLDILRHLPAGLCHMSGIPLNIHITSPFQNR